MKNTRKVSGFAAIIAVIALNALLMTACPDDGGDNGSGGNGTGGGGKIDYTADTIEALSGWLANKPANAASAPYTIKLKVNDLTNFQSLRGTLNTLGRYVYLDLSGSVLTTIPDSAFYGKESPYGCAALVGITIPRQVPCRRPRDVY